MWIQGRQLNKIGRLEIVYKKQINLEQQRKVKPKIEEDKYLKENRKKQMKKCKKKLKKHCPRLQEQKNMKISE